MKTHRHSLLISLLFCAYCSQAQAAGSTELDTLVVEGQSHSSIQINTSTSNTRLDNIRLEDTHIDTLTGLEKMVPGLKLSNQGTARFSINTLRGLGDITRQDYFNSSIAVMVDGVYIPPAELDLSLLNIESVEVIRGPQNAKFGRNAIAGAINIKTRRLKDAQGIDLTLGAGNKSSRQGTVSATGQLHDNLFANLTIHGDSYDGFIHNLDDGKSMDNRDNVQIKSRMEWDINDRLQARLSLNHIDKTVGNSGNQPYANYTQRLTDLTGGNREDFDILNYDLHFNYSGESVDFRSITSHHDYKVRMFMDLGYTQAPGMPAGGFFPKGVLSNSTEEGEVLSQTFEWQSKKKKESSFDWLFGLQFDREKHLYEYIFSTMSEIETDYTRKDYSAFAQGIWHLNPLLSLKTSARYTQEDHSATGTAYSVDGMTGATVIVPIGGKKDETAFSPRVELAYQPDANSTYFSSLSQGTRGGGLNRIQMLAPYDKETVTTAEFGLKKYFPKQSLSLSSTLFYNDWRDMQVKQFQNGGSSYGIENAAEAASYGLEVEANWYVNNNVNLFMNALLLESEFKKFDRGTGEDFTGNQLPSMPEQSLTLGGVWRQPMSHGGTWMLAADYAWKGTHYFDVENRLEDSYGLLSFKTGLEYDDWQVHLWAKNLLNENFLLHAYKDDFGIDVATPGRGREYGIELKAQF